MLFYNEATKYMFFSGKGGVGKTSLACATAIRLADDGKKVLLVSTDPASNLGQVFDATIREHNPTAIPGVPNLEALNIDPDKAAQAYRDRIVGPVRDSLPESVVRRMEEELSGACTTEIAAFDEFTALLTDSQTSERYDHIIFDTAPTGHTLRLLTLPRAWADFIDANPEGASCLGPLAGLEKQRTQYEAAVSRLGEAAWTTMVLVSRPQEAAMKEAARTAGELRALGIQHLRLVINGILPPPSSGDPLAESIRQRQMETVESIPGPLADIPTDHVPLRPFTILGVEGLRALLDSKEEDVATSEDTPPPEVEAPSLGEMTDAIEADGHGLVMVMGKGGVGKTTIAAAIAIDLAARGHEVHLSTTDPAAHIEHAIDGAYPRLAVSRIDPEVETARYRAEVLESKGKNLDEAGRATLEEDLRSPCTEEIAIFKAFSKVIREARHKFVVLDTAPTGHTLLLLDATGSYHREITRHAKEGVRVTTPMMMLQNPEQTKMLIVTLPETTPVLEAASLQEDLRRAGIEPWAWIVNASLAAAVPSDPFLIAKAHSEVSQIDKVRKELSQRFALLPMAAEEPTGEEALQKLSYSART